MIDYLGLEIQQSRAPPQIDKTFWRTLHINKPEQSLICKENSLMELASPLPTTKKQICRICLESEGTMITPCDCRGSIEYVHEPCLKAWITLSHKDQLRKQKGSLNRRINCEVCKKCIPFSIVRARRCRNLSISLPVQKRYSLAGRFSLILLLLGVAGALTNFGTKAILNHTTNEVGNVSFGIGILMLVIASLFFAVTVWLVTQMAISYFFEFQVEIYKIESLEDQQASEMNSPKIRSRNKLERVYPEFVVDSHQHRNIRMQTQ